MNKYIELVFDWFYKNFKVVLGYFINPKDILGQPET